MTNDERKELVDLLVDILDEVLKRPDQTPEMFFRRGQSSHDWARENREILTRDRSCSDPIRRARGRKLRGFLQVALDMLDEVRRERR